MDFAKKDKYQMVQDNSGIENMGKMRKRIRPVIR